nr:MAG TPA: hypothetical protein [Caudoviricetes sp.]
MIINTKTVIDNLHIFIQIMASAKTFHCKHPFCLIF